MFRAGAALSNITPPLGEPIVGGFLPFPATHVHDELHARCLVLDDGTTRLAIVICDLLGASREMFDAARKLVEQETGIAGANVLLAGTHTHSAVSALSTERYVVGEALNDYQQSVVRKIADGVRRATNNLVPAQVGWGTAMEPNHVFNRRWFMKPGTIPPSPLGEPDGVKMNPPRASENLLKPAGPTDPEIVLLAVRTLEGRPIAVLANYSLHYVGGVGPGHISADYFAMFCDRLQELLKADRFETPFVGLLANGTSGNINNIDFSKPGKAMPPYARMREVANDVAQAAFKSHQSIQFHDWVALGARIKELELATRRPTEQQIERAKGILARPKPETRTLNLEEIYAIRMMSMEKQPAKLFVPIQVLRVGGMAIGALPGEVFVETGLEFKAKSPFQPACIISVANGYFGYLPTPAHIVLGGYETWMGTNRLEADAAPKMLATLLSLLAELK
ncbi:MAG: hypothetical protein EXS24_02125 [Pedosphaera sp.]|nr:hypothetical protein [Pedosphaera sp.]